MKGAVQSKEEEDEEEADAVQDAVGDEYRQDDGGRVPQVKKEAGQVVERRGGIAAQRGYFAEKGGWQP